MKVGDIVVCLKNYYIIHRDYDILLVFKKNDKYKIDKIEDNFIHVSSSLLFEKSGIIFKFCLEKNDEIIVDEIFSDYFITEQNYRKLKLDKINERRR